MADAAEFNIDIQAKTVGVDASVDQVNAFADKIRATNAVATQFDTAIAAANERLKEAAGAAKVAADAVSLAETKYNELERAANKAAKEVEKATQAGKDTTALKVAAETAAAAMHKQALAVDELRAKSTSAAAAEKKLADSLKTLEKQQASAVAEIKKAPSATDKFNSALQGLGLGDKVEKFKKLKEGMGGLHAATLVTAGVFSVMSLAIAGAVLGFAAFALSTNVAAMQRLSAAGSKLKNEVKGLFSGLKFDKFLDGLDDMVGMFDKGTSAGGALKFLIETIFQPLFDGAAKAMPLVKEFFKGMIYGALQVAIAVLKARKAILDFLPPEVKSVMEQFSEKLFSLESAFTLGTYAAFAIAGAIALVTLAMLGMAIAELAALWPILLVIAAVWLLYEAFENWGEITDWLSGVWDDFVTGLSDVWDGMVESAKTAATDMIDGLVNGIKKGVSKVVGAVKDLASNALSAFTGSDGIDAHSPSRKFHMFGEWSGEGYAGGVDSSTGMVEDSAEGMAQAATSSAGNATGGASKGGGGKSITINQLNIGEGKVAQENWQTFKQMLLAEFEGAVITVGGGEAPAP